MIPKMRFGWARLPLLVAGVSLATMLAAAAQTPPANDEAETQEAEETEAAPSVNDVDIMKDIDVDKLDWSQLNVDASTLMDLMAKGGSSSKGAASADASWSANERANGTSAVSVKQSISPFWDTRIGADMTVARQGTATTSEQLSEKLANGGSLPQSSGTAWAAITAPGVASIWDKTAVEARVDPGSEQSKLGTSLSKSLPISEQYSLTLRNDYNLIQQGIVPVPGIVSHPSRSYETDQSARLSIADTGTSFLAGQTLSTSDDKWLRKVGAEQKLFDGVTISGSIGETPSGVASKSLSAGFKRSW
ncbi:hypothetical protein CQ14_40695 [Bradyrhizobium lablabi]|uniref:Uncharacterized protein n=2 Tax=Bradyrhizobium lablabi TaxID=722472 RepID=A0A0R3NEM8_9BRAD|nr:hypothetical protein CQ14_40695 [Bradyrhizobium lablabi]